MLKLFLFIVLIYIITIFIVIAVIHKETPKLTWKQAIRELDDIPIIFIPILNTCIIIVYLIADLIERRKSDS